MGTLADTIRAGIATAKSILSSGQLLVTVQHYAYQSQNEYGEPQYGAAVSRQAVVTNTNELVRDPERGEIVARLAFLFLEDFEITPRDKIVLSDGTTTPIISIGLGVLDTTLGNFYVKVLVE